MSLPEFLTSRELASLHGITVQSLGAHEARGIVKKIKRDCYPLAASAALSEHFREIAAGRKSAGAGDKLDLVAERARLAKEQADGVEIKNAALRNELVPASVVENRWATILSTIRATMLALPGELSQLLSHLTRSDLDVIDRAVRDALNQAADEIGSD